MLENVDFGAGNHPDVEDTPPEVEEVGLAIEHTQSRLSDLRYRVTEFMNTANDSAFRQKIDEAQKLPEGTEEEIRKKEEAFIRIHKEQIQKDPRLDQSEKQQVLKAFDVAISVNPEIYNQIDKLKAEIINQNVATQEYANNQHIKEAIILLNDSSEKGLVRAKQLLNIAENRSKFAFTQDINTSKDFIIYRAIQDLMYDKIKKSPIDKESQECQTETSKIAESIGEQATSAKENLFKNSSKVHLNIHQAITLKREELLATGNGLDAEMKAVVSYLRGGQLTPNAMAVINNSRNDATKKSLIEQFEKVKNKTKDTDKLDNEAIKKLDSGGQIFLAACLELCEEAKIRMAHDMGFVQYDKNGIPQINESEMANWLEKYFGEAQGMQKYDLNNTYNYANAGTLSSKLNWKNFFVYEVGFHFGILTAVLNTMAAIRTGNWDNEYIYLGLATTYLSYKEVKEDHIEGWLHPEKIPFILAGQVNKNEAACFTNENELKLAKMIDWRTLRKRARKEDNLMGESKPSRAAEVFSGLSDNKKPKQSKDASLGQITKEELDKLNKTNSIPLINSSDQGRSDFKLAIADLPENHNFERWEFYNKILKDSRYSSADVIDTVAFHVQQIVDTRGIKL